MDKAMRILNKDHDIQQAKGRICFISSKRADLIRNNYMIKSISKRNALTERDSNPFVCLPQNSKIHPNISLDRKDSSQFQKLELDIFKESKRLNYQNSKLNSSRIRDQISSERKESMVRNKLRRFRIVQSRNTGRHKISDFLQTKMQKISEKKSRAKELENCYLEVKFKQVRTRLVNEEQDALKGLEEDLSFQSYLLAELLRPA